MLAQKWDKTSLAQVSFVTCPIPYIMCSFSFVIYITRRYGALRAPTSSSFGHLEGPSGPLHQAHLTLHQAHHTLTELLMFEVDVKKTWQRNGGEEEGTSSGLGFWCPASRVMFHVSYAQCPESWVLCLVACVLCHLLYARVLCPAFWVPCIIYSVSCILIIESCI